MTREVFEEGLKLLTRFLKENGMYYRVFRCFLFKDNRPIEDLFKEFNSTVFSDVDNWGVLFKRVNLMGGFSKFDYYHYSALGLDKLTDKWKQYYKANTKNNLKHNKKR